MNLGEINSEIARLTKQKTQLINDKNKVTEESIKSLNWTKDCHAYLKVDPLGGAAGLYKYHLELSGSQLPCTYDLIRLMGDHAISNRNIMYGRSGFGNWGGWESNHSVFTDDAKLLIEFIKIAKFKSITYDEEMLSLLKAVEEVSKNQ